jgi:hypothetical protein
MSERVTEGRNGSAGAPRALGGAGGHVGAPPRRRMSERVTEGRNGSAGAPRALGGAGGHVGAPRDEG